jgi:Mannosyl-glycoprotein endo-beta-N-acetylglucosaminidase
MPRIPLSEIPNVPQLPGGPPVAPYGQVPGAKFATQPYVRGHVEPMRTIANFEQYAKDLQQAPLPGGFAQGQEMIVSAAGRYASVAGQAESAWATSVSKALNNVGSIISDAATNANQSKDAVDQVRYSWLEKNATEAFENQMREEKVPIEQWKDRWDKEGAPRFLETARLYGESPKTRAIIDARATGFAQSQSLHWTAKLFEKTHKDNAEFLTATANEALEKEDAASARDAINELYAQNYINEATYKLDMAKADKVEHQATINFVRSRNPQALKDQAIAAREGKATDEFQFLNNDPALARKTLSEANAEINTRQQEALTSISNKVLKREVKMTDEDIASEARAAGLDEKEVKTLQSYNKTDVVYNDRLVADANAAVASYDPLNDIDPKTKLPGMGQYKQIIDLINTTVPKEMRGPLMNELNKAYREGMSGKPKDGREKEVSFVLDRLKLYRDEGILIDPKTGKPLPSGLPEKKGEKLSPEDTAKIAAADKEYLKVQSQLQEWARNNPQFEPGQFVDKLNELTSVHKEAAAKTDASYKEQKAFEEKVLRAAPTRVPGTPAAVPRIGIPSQAEMEERFRHPPAAPGTGPRLMRGYYTPTTSMAPGKVFVGSLAGKEDVFNAAAKKYGLDPALLMAIAMHETGKGTSTMVAERNNPGGLFDSKANDYYRFASVGEGIDAMARNLKKNYIDKGLTTIEQIQKEYAPVGAKNDPQGLNKDWAAGVSKFYEQIKGAGGAQQKVGSTTGKPAHVTASIAQVVNPGAPNEMIQGSLNVAGKPYEYKSGGYGRGDLPPGEYIVTEHRYSRDTPGMTVGDVGFSFALTDKYDQRVGGTRTLLRIHPDGGTAGTAGCIGIVGGKDVQKQFRDDMTTAIRQAGGQLRLVVG